MKTVFIVNPKAGQGCGADALVGSIENIIAQTGSDAMMYVTKIAGDGTEFVRKYCQENGPARFIACGGDGTLNEVLNGVAGFEDAEVGVLPSGTGNDFCRNFPCSFKEISSQITGQTVKCDAIKYVTVYNDVVKEGYCINMFNIGFDCNVADMTANLKNKPFLSGSMAYFVSILLTLIKKKGADLKIELDGEVKHNGRLLLTSIANGCYCGGGVKSNPLASVTDGLISVNIIRNVSRIRFITLLPYYMKGTFTGLKGIDKYITCTECRKITVTPNGGHMRLCIDGEIIDAGKAHFEIAPGAFNFVVPGKNDVVTEKEKEETAV